MINISLNAFKIFLAESGPLLDSSQAADIQQTVHNLSQKADAHMAIINQVDGTLTKVILTIGLVGILLPIIVQYFQNKKLKFAGLKLEKKFNKQIIEYRNSTFDTIKVLENEYQQMIISLQQEQQIQSYFSEANTFYIQGITFFYKGDHKSAIVNFLSALYYFNQCKKTGQLITTLTNLIACLKLISTEQLLQAKEEITQSDGLKSADYIIAQIKYNYEPYTKVDDKLKEVEKLFLNKKTLLKQLK